MRKKSILIMLVLMLVISCMPVYAASVPARVTGLKVRSASSQSVTLRWSKAKGARTYQVYMSKQGKSKGFKRVATASKSSAVIRNLTPGKSYWFKVRAVKGKKKGKFSKVLKFTSGAGSETPTSNYTAPVGNTFRAFLPSGYTKFIEQSQSVGFTSNSIPMSFITFSAETSRTLSVVKSGFAGNEMTYSGISGYEYDNGSSERSFSFESGGYLYTVSVAAKNPAALLHVVLAGLSW